MHSVRKEVSIPEQRLTLGSAACCYLDLCLGPASAPRNQNPWGWGVRQMGGRGMAPVDLHMFPMPNTLECPVELSQHLGT